MYFPVLLKGGSLIHSKNIGIEVGSVITLLNIFWYTSKVESGTAILFN